MEEESEASECSSSCEEIYDGPKKAQNQRVVRFSGAQRACLTSYYRRGMSGCGKKHAVVIEKAAKDTGLTVRQVKVRSLIREPTCGVLYRHALLLYPLYDSVCG